MKWIAVPTPSRCTIDSVDRAATKTALACPQSVHRCTSTYGTLHQRLSTRWQRLLNARVPGDGGAGATAGCKLTHGAAAAQSRGDRLSDGVRSQCEGMPCIVLAALQQVCRVGETELTCVMLALEEGGCRVQLATGGVQDLVVTSHSWDRRDTRLHLVAHRSE